MKAVKVANVTAEFAPFPGHIVFGDPKVIAEKAARGDYNKHPRIRKLARQNRNNKK